MDKMDGCLWDKIWGKIENSIWLKYISYWLTTNFLTYLTKKGIQVILIIG